VSTESRKKGKGDERGKKKKGKEREKKEPRV